MLYFYLQPFQPKAGLPRGGGVKKNTLPVKQQVGFSLRTFGLQLNALTTWPQCHAEPFFKILLLGRKLTVKTLYSSEYRIMIPWHSNTITARNVSLTYDQSIELVAHCKLQLNKHFCVVLTVMTGVLYWNLRLAVMSRCSGILMGLAIEKVVSIVHRAEYYYDHVMVPKNFFCSLQL